MKRMSLLAAAALASTLTFTDAEARRYGSAPALDENADGIADGRARDHRGRGLRGARQAGPLGEAIAELTEEQKAELKDLHASLRESEVTREEAHIAMQDKLGEFGVDLPDFETIQAEREAVRAEATAQREAVRTLVDGLRAEGATREEIRDALAEAGYDKAGPRGGGRGHRGHHGPRGGPPADTAPENGE